MRGAGRLALVNSARSRLARQLGARGEPREAIAAARQVLDPNVLTLGFARRFTDYKRPNLLLHDAARLRRLLTDPQHPTQVVLAGKAHPADDNGKRMICDWIEMERRPELRQRIVFLEDYDLGLAQEMVQGVDVWLNTPRRPWEACGTSGMKVLVNGGINLSVLEGWWQEACDPEVGWAIGDGDGLDVGEGDRRDAAALYEVLESAVVPEFYARDQAGLPRRWLARIRHSLSRLTPAYSSNRMLLQHIEQLYLPAAAEYRRRATGNDPTAAAMREWECRPERGWPLLHIGQPTVSGNDGSWRFSVPVYLGEIGTGDVRVELYADPAGAAGEAAIRMNRGAAVAGSINGYIFEACVSASRNANDYTVRVTPEFAGAVIPSELNLILWQR
jgi:starch phosphorylase